MGKKEESIAKKKQKEIEQTKVAMLEMIHDRVQKSKRKDRYIVTSNNKWGVTDGDGNFIIPMEFSNIQTSNDTVFRVYGKDTGKMVGNHIFCASVKEQALYDYDGNCIVPMTEYSKSLALSKTGLILGQADYCTYREFNGQLKILKYTGEMLDIENTRICLGYSDAVPNMIAMGSIDTTFTHGIMLDTDKLEIKPLENCYNKIIHKKLSIANTEVTDDELKEMLEKQGIEHPVDEDTDYIIGVTNSGNVILNEDYSPLINIKNKKAKYKLIYNRGRG